MKIIKRSKNPKNKEVMDEQQQSMTKSEDCVSLDLSKKIEENYEKFQAFLKESSDAVFRKFKLGRSGINCALVYIDGLIDMLSMIQFYGQ